MWESVTPRRGGVPGKENTSQAHTLLATSATVTLPWHRMTTGKVFPARAGPRGAAGRSAGRAILSPDSGQPRWPRTADCGGWPACRPASPTTPTPSLPPDPRHFRVTSCHALSLTWWREAACCCADRPWEAGARAR